MLGVVRLQEERANRESRREEIDGPGRGSRGRTLAYAILSSTSAATSPSLRRVASMRQEKRLLLGPARRRTAGTARLSAIDCRRCGLNVPSVSTYRALPSPPPCEKGSWKRELHAAGVSLSGGGARQIFEGFELAARRA